MLEGYVGWPEEAARRYRDAGLWEGLTVAESRNYVKRILVLAESYRSLYSDLS